MGILPTLLVTYLYISILEAYACMLKNVIGSAADSGIYQLALGTDLVQYKQKE